MSHNAFMFTSNDLIAVIDGERYTIPKTHPRWNAIMDAYRDKEYAEIVKIVSPVTAVEFEHRDLLVRYGVVTFRGRSLPTTITNRIIDMVHNGFDVNYMVMFLENLFDNPSCRAVEELYQFLEGCSLPITDDGHFLAYKRVTSEYLDFHTETIDNSVGKVVEMPRNEVDDNHTKTCSTGLHFCSLPYLSTFHPSEGVIIVVKVNPKDVVSIPVDYNFTKGRTCKYEVIGIHHDETVDKWDTPCVHSENIELDPAHLGSSLREVMEADGLPYPPTNADYDLLLGFDEDEDEDEDEDDLL